MRFFKILLVIFVFFSACKKKQVIETTNQTKVVDTLALTKEEVSKLSFKDIRLDPKADLIVSNWQAYTKVAVGIESIKLLDLTFFNADKELFNSTITDFEATIPEAISTDPIKARLLALKTLLYKFQEIEDLKTSIKTQKLIAIKEMFIAFSNLNLQINKKLEKESQNIEKPY